jgi:ABC-type polysaccharide/polyol phosphate export permease
VLAELRELYRFRELLWILVLRDLKVRYKNSALGFLWSLINPAVQVAVMSFVVKYFMKVEVPNLSAYIFCAFLPWSFFQLSLLDTSHSLIVNERLMKKVYFPREIIPLSLVLSNLIHLLLAILVFLAYLVVWIRLLDPMKSGPPLLPTMARIPFLIVIEVFLVTGIALVVSGVSVFYEDVKYLMTVLLQVLYFAVPVMYFAEQVKISTPNHDSHGLLFKIYMLNPLVTILTAFRAWMLLPIYIPPSGLSPAHSVGIQTSPDVPMGYLLFTTVVSLMVAWGGYALFNRMKWSFVERP